ncbi:MAG TPA: aminoacyl--tRNA ligase-related protein, partial [Candidatus Dormibacteraeota bacterium]|nr:aminoacyl--tRNA ligase-related protein [Candidatus Dormibacteraeota bacterium]
HMRLSKTFIKTTKNIPSSEKAKNAQLLIRAGYIHKEMAGVYSFLPLGLKVLENIKKIIRDEMNGLEFEEILMPSLQPKDVWEKTDRWDDQKVDIWFKSSLKNGTEVGFGWSHEEQINSMLNDYISSYRDLPLAVYQFQTKLRNETRSKSGILRCREFLMKDLYSYSLNEKQHDQIYQNVIKAYHSIFKKLGLDAVTYFTFASGGSFTQFSHEFQTISDAGEDIIYVDHQKKIAINQEVFSDNIIKQLGLKRTDLKKYKAAEVANIFSFGTSKTDAFDLKYTDEKGALSSIYMGSYGIGVTRLMGIIVEHFADDKGIIWPKSIAPSRIIIVRIGDKPKVVEMADKIYEEIRSRGIEVIYDDRDLRPGEKFSDADLLGIPSRIIISDKTVESGLIEFKDRTSTEVQYISRSDVIDKLSDK